MEKEFTPIAGGWVAYNGHYLKELVRLKEKVFFLYESDEGFGIARLADGDLHFSLPLSEDSLINAARDLLFTVCCPSPFYKLMDIGMSLERHGLLDQNGQIEMALEIRTGSVSVIFRRLAWSVQGRKFVKYYAEIEQLGITLSDVEFRFLVPALARALGAR